MDKSYDYVAPDYKIRFGISGDWFLFQNADFEISGELKYGVWRLVVCNIRKGYPYVITNKLELDDLPYKTLVSFRKALGIKGLEWVLDSEVTLLEEEK